MKLKTRCLDTLHLPNSTQYNTAKKRNIDSIFSTDPIDNHTKTIYFTSEYFIFPCIFIQSERSKSYNKTLNVTCCVFGKLEMIECHFYKELLNKNMLIEF
jgi:hypothetical protein